ncbi:sensor histidine kinase [Cytobacillus suaedae]|nr:sensor histidine kinase [Cytobacillus suaedae]
MQLTFLVLFFSLSFIFIGLFLFSYRSRKLPYLLYFGLFMITISINLLGIWNLQANLPFPSLLKYLSFGAGTFFLLFYEQIFGQGYKKIHQRLWQLHLLCWIMIVLTSFLSLVPLEEVQLPYSILNISTILYVAIVTIAKAQSGNREAKIFTFGLLGLIVTLLFDLSFTIKIANYASSQTTTWGLLLFTGCLTVILLNRFIKKGADFIFEPLTFVHDPIELKMKADSLVLHTIKNEIHRLLYLNERNKRLLSSMDQSLSTPLEKNYNLMDEALHHMNDMILAVKRTDDVELHLQNVSINNVILEAIRTFRTGLNTSIEFELNLIDSITIEVDPLHLKECITNLVSNSVEAIEHSHGKIRIDLYQRNHEAILEITDNGKGIHQDQLLDVITPLFTTKKSTTHFGVGLYYVYFVINKHGGSLSIPYSQVGKGTTFRIQLPINRKMKQFWSVKASGKNKSHAG